MRRFALAVLLATLPVLAGCMGAEDRAPAAEGPREEAPEWLAGFAWNFSIFDAEERHIGAASYEVLAREPHGNGLAYRVRERYAAPELEGELRVREVLVDTVTLNEMATGCGAACPAPVRHLDFPLAANKSWTTPGGTIALAQELAATARPVDGAPEGSPGITRTWNVTLVPVNCAACGAARVELVYAPELGILVERTDYAEDGAIHRRWILTEFDLRPLNT